MLQQTQVATVLPRYAAWFDRFPTVTVLAEAPLDDVLKAWEGLGYYRRARFIHQAAIRIETEFSGRFPQYFDDMMSLPGIGRSTAGAIASFCFGQPTPVLDGNVKRVLRRWHDQPQASDKTLWLLAQQAMDATNNPALWNQAMMELGATHCAARSAACNECPVSEHCLSAWQVEPDTEKKQITAVQDVYWRVDLHRCPQRGIWLCQRPASGIWAGLWTPPITTLSRMPTGEPVHIHQLSHRRIHLYSEQLATAPEGEGQWVSDISQLALPTGIHRLLEKIGDTI